jgi:hypothetical protein
LKYNSTYHTLLAGLNFDATDALKFGVSLVWNTSDAAMDPFRMINGEQWSAAKPQQWFNFSETYRWSDLDTERVYGTIWGQFDISENFFLWGGYTYQDFSDNAPYVMDLNGNADTFAGRIGYSF